MSLTEVLLEVESSRRFGERWRPFTGLGGVGKTRLALEHAFRMPQAPSRYWRK